jgi:hypothetical protein
VLLVDLVGIQRTDPDSNFGGPVEPTCSNPVKTGWSSAVVQAIACTSTYHAFQESPQKNANVMIFEMESGVPRPAQVCRPVIATINREDGQSFPVKN